MVPKPVTCLAIVLTCLLPPGCAGFKLLKGSPPDTAKARASGPADDRLSEVQRELSLYSD